MHRALWFQVTTTTTTKRWVSEPCSRTEKKFGILKWLRYRWNWCAWYSNQRFATGTGGLGNKRTSGDHPNYGIVEIGQNTEKSPGDSRRLAVTQTPMKNQQVTLVGKNSQKWK